MVNDYDPVQRLCYDIEKAAVQVGMYREGANPDPSAIIRGRLSKIVIAAFISEELFQTLAGSSFEVSLGYGLNLMTDSFSVPGTLNLTLFAVAGVSGLNAYVPEFGLVPYHQEPPQSGGGSHVFITH